MSMTGQLGVFRTSSHISLLRYCPKRLSFSYDGYTMRNELAVLDHNAHVNREEAETADGLPVITSKESRRTKEWVAYKTLQKKSFSYIPGKSGLLFCFGIMRTLSVA